MFKALTDEFYAKFYSALHKMFGFLIINERNSYFTLRTYKSDDL